MSGTGGFTIGVLAVQGDVEENLIAAHVAVDEMAGHYEGAGDGGNGGSGEYNGVPAPGEMADVSVTTANTPEEISLLDGLIIPGGESTAIGKLCAANGCLQAIRERIAGGMPALGICAGMIMLSKTADDRVVGSTGQPLLDILDVKLERNSFGRQQESFEAEISMEAIGIAKFNGVFIRAPSISDVGPGVEVLARLGDKIVAVRKGGTIGTSFHPELTEDTSLHRHFVDTVVRSAAGRSGSNGA